MAALAATSAVSASRISPTRMTSGSCRRIARRPAPKVTLNALRIEETNDGLLGILRRHGREPQVVDAPFDPDTDAAVLRAQAVGDVELAEHFDPRNHTMQRWHLHVVLQHAVDTEPNDATVRRGFHVDITGPLLHRLGQHHVGQLNDRLRLGLGIGDRFRFGTLLDADAARHINTHASQKALDVAFRGVVLLDRLGERARGRHLERYAAPRGERDRLLHLEVDRIAGGDHDRAIVLAHRDHQVPLRELFGRSLSAEASTESDPRAGPRA